MLSIIIVNYKTSRDIKLCLDSIVEHESRCAEYEFIIVDNNSDDPGLAGIKTEYPFVTIIHAPYNNGFAYGCNIGIRHSRGEFILLLNPDTFIDDNSIEKLYDYLIKNPDVHFIGPMLLFRDRSNQSYFEPKAHLTLWRLFCEKFYLHRIFSGSKIFNSYYRTYMDYNSVTEVEAVAGSAFMFRREVIDTLGPLDENYFMYFEESDYCLKAKKNGFRLLYYPPSKIIHTGGLISESNWERSTKNYVASFKYYFKKNFGRITYYTAILIFYAGSMLRVIILRLAGNKKYSYYLYYMRYLIKT